MKSARFENSHRLQRVLDFLIEANGPVSTMEIVKGANVMAVNSAVAELRDNGFEIHCERRGMYWYYSMPLGAMRAS